jgi:hypothetical protein
LLKIYKQDTSLLRYQKRRVYPAAQGSTFFAAQGSTFFAAQGSTFFAAQGSTFFAAQGSTFFAAQGSTFFAAQGSTFFAAQGSELVSVAVLPTEVVVLATLSLLATGVAIAVDTFILKSEIAANEARYLIFMYFFRW